MRVFDLACAADHRFEGWFASENDFVDQTERHLTACPICADTDITRLPSAPRLVRPASAEPDQRRGVAPSAGALPSNPVQAHQAAWLAAVRHVIATTEDVGERFAEQARRMHYGESEARPIRGRASPQEAMALVEEGVQVVPLPVPEAMKQPLQ